MKSMKFLVGGVFLCALTLSGANAAAMQSALPPIRGPLTRAFQSVPSHALPAVVNFLRFPTEQHSARTYELLDSAFRSPDASVAPASLRESLRYVGIFSAQLDAGLSEMDVSDMMRAHQKLYELSEHVPQLIPAWQIVSAHLQAREELNSRRAEVLLASARRIAANWGAVQADVENHPPLAFPEISREENPSNELHLQLKVNDRAKVDQFRLLYSPGRLGLLNGARRALGPNSIDYSRKHVLAVHASADHLEIQLMGPPYDHTRFDDGPVIRIARATGQIDFFCLRGKHWSARLWRMLRAEFRELIQSIDGPELSSYGKSVPR